MSRWISFADSINKKGGILITEKKHLKLAPMPGDPMWISFLDRWSSYKSEGFLNEWGLKTLSPKLDKTEINLWKTYYGDLSRTLDSAGQTGIVFLKDSRSAQWSWYFVFGYPTLTERPCGWIIIQNHCPAYSLEKTEKQIGQRLPPIARVYYRIMGSMVLSGDLNLRNGILGLEPSYLGQMGNLDENWLGLENWVPWNKQHALLCTAFLDYPDEIWWTREGGDNLFLVSHDPGEVQDYMDNLASLIKDWLFFVDEKRWKTADPFENDQLGYDALNAGSYDEAASYYRNSAEGHLQSDDKESAQVALSMMSEALRRSGKYSEALKTAVSVINETSKLSEINEFLQGALRDAVNVASDILLSQKKPEQVIKLTQKLCRRTELLKDERWQIMKWLLMALIEQNSKEDFMNEWNTLLNDIYAMRKSKFPPAEPDLQDIIKRAKDRNWAVDFIVKS